LSKKHKAPKESTDKDASPVPDSAGEEPTDREESADPGESPPQQPSREALLERMAEKSRISDELRKENTEKEAQIKELNDKWLRTAAEFENYRKRTRKEWELLKQRSKAEVILEILSVLDDFERAFAVVEEAEPSDYVEGFRLIYNNLTQILEKIGVKQLDTLHTPFDPNYHMAVGQVDSETLESGQVAEVVLQGYLLGDTVIRPANVIVAK
jgi:molecular chaperone GrpE